MCILTLCFFLQGLFSATQTNELEALVRAGLRNPVRITVREKNNTNKVCTSAIFDWYSAETVIYNDKFFIFLDQPKNSCIVGKLLPGMCQKKILKTLYDTHIRTSVSYWNLCMTLISAPLYRIETSVWHSYQHLCIILKPLYDTHIRTSVSYWNLCMTSYQNLCIILKPLYDLISEPLYHIETSVWLSYQNLCMTISYKDFCIISKLPSP